MRSSEHDPLVAEYQHDKHRPEDDRALWLLKKVASLVKPVMRNHGWKINTLCELYPSERNLLGLNVRHGSSIKIHLRLRYASNQRSFLRLEAITDTMLHELCHIVHAPHNRDFHALWNKLRDEHMDLVMKGYTGEGFLSPGHRLGGIRVPQHEVRRRAVTAAAKRNALGAKSGIRLGGTPKGRGVDIRKIRADAAERRMAITDGCASGAPNAGDLEDEETRRGSKTKAEENEANDQAILEAYVDLIEQEEREQGQENQNWKENGEDPKRATDPTHLFGSSVPRKRLPPPPSSRTANPPPSGLVDLTNTDDEEDNEEKDATKAKDSWTCPVCTLENPPNYLACDACASERPHEKQPLSPTLEPRDKKPRTVNSQASTSAAIPVKNSPTSSRQPASRSERAIRSLVQMEHDADESPLGWVCYSCGTFTEKQWWTCTTCGMMRPSSP